jgi:hypothetical protein
LCVTVLDAGVISKGNALTLHSGCMAEVQKLPRGSV